MSHHIVILAQGDQHRLAGLGHPKHLLAISDTETIIGRTFRQLGEHFPGAKVILVCDGAPIWKPYTPAEVEMVTLAPATCLCQRIWQTTPLWGDGTTLLLGDVAFSHRALERLSIANRLTFIGRRGENRVTGCAYGELFGLTAPFLEDRIALRDALRPSLWAFTPGRLWDLLDLFNYDDPLVDLGPNDYTDDIDSPHEIEEALPRLRAAVARDDAK